jgi:hypothetical protein
MPLCGEGKTLGAACSIKATLRPEGSPVGMHFNVAELMVVKARSPHLGIVQGKTKRLNKMELSPRIGAKPNDVAGVWRNLGLDKDNLEVEIRG